MGWFFFITLLLIIKRFWLFPAPNTLIQTSIIENITIKGYYLIFEPPCSLNYI